MGSVTNGQIDEPVNGHVNGTASEVAATDLIASFIVNSSTSQLTSELRARVKEVLVDYMGVTIGAVSGADSTEPIYKSILAFQGGEVKGGKVCTVVGKGVPHILPQYAGFLNAALSHSLDFDDTYIEGTLHSGCTAIPAALTQAELLGCQASIDDFLLAVSVGYEVTCRVGRELGFEAYHRGFHNTSTAGIFGAIAAIASLKKLSAGIVVMAFGLAGSKAGGSMQYLDNGSWNKRLHPAFAVHDAFLCVNLAESGVIGATRSLEGKNGFLKAYSPNEKKDLNRLVEGLGQKWDWLYNALKPYPACRMTHPIIELAGNIHNEFEKVHDRTLVVDDIQQVRLSIPESNFILVGDPTPNKIHPLNVVDGQFSAYFQAAIALLHGSRTGLQAYKRLTDPEVNALTSKIKVIADPRAVRGFPGRIQIVWKDGKEEERYQEFALGEVQNPFTRERVEEKFVSLVSPACGEDKAKEILQAIDKLEDSSVAALLETVR